MGRSWVCEACGAAPSDQWPDHLTVSEVRSEILGRATYDEVRPITALFADVVGSTSLGERLRPDEVKTLIGECVTRMANVVESYGGAVRSYMGDGVAAFFGIDSAREDDPVRAALAGLKVLRVISEYALEIRAAWEIPSVSVRVGINSGRVATGLVGSEEQRQHVALGDPVNVAARLQARAAPGTALVGAATASLLGARFELRRVGQLDIRGRNRPVEAWELVRYVGEPTVAYEGPFVGRSSELAAFSRSLHDLRAGRGQIVTILGDAGIGKSRLLTEVRGRQVGDVVWMSGRCSDERVQAPYGAFLDMLREWLEIDASTPAVVVRIRLRARLREVLGADVDPVLPFLSPALSVETQEDTESLNGRGDSGAGFRQAYAIWVSALAHRAPVVMAVDDLHKASSSTTTLLQALFQLVDRTPLMIVVAMRPLTDNNGWRSRVTALGSFSHRTRELQLTPIDDIEAQEIVALLDPENALTGALRRNLRMRAEGNPFYLEELLRAASESASSPLLTDEDEVSIPETLAGLLLARIDRVPLRARVVLQLAAVCGRRFPRTLLERASAPEVVEEDLACLIREGILQEAGRVPRPQYSFRHGLYRDAVLATLTESRRRALHETVGRTLEAGPEADQQLEAIANHYLLSGNRDKALNYLERAAERSAVMGTLVEALELFDQARDLAALEVDTHRYLELSRRAASAANEMGHYEEAIGRWRQVWTDSTSTIQRSSALCEIARTELDLGQMSAAEAACREALALRPDADTRTAATLCLARISLRKNELDGVAELLHTQSEERPNLPTELKLELSDLWCGYLAQAGKFEDAETWAERAVSHATELNDPGAILKAKRDLGIVRLVLGRLSESSVLLESVFTDAMKSARTVRAHEAIANLVCVYLLLGELRAGLTAAEDAINWLPRSRWRAAVLDNLGGIEIELGRLDDARAHLGESVHIAKSVQDASLVGSLSEVRLASIDLLEGRPEQAAERTARALTRARTVTGRLDVQVKASVQLAEIALWRRDNDQALRFASRAAEIAAEADLTETPAAQRVLGLARVTTGDRNGLADLTSAIDAARSMEMRLEEGRALVALGSVEEDVARHNFHRARQIFAHCGSARGLAEVREAVARSQHA